MPTTQPTAITKISDYCIAEFFPNMVSMTPSPSFHHLYDKNTSTHQVFNPNGSVTGNQQDYTAHLISSNQYVYLDQDVVTPYWVQYAASFYYDQPAGYEFYNKVRFHFLSGYDFLKNSGTVLTVKNRMNNGSYCTFACLLVTADWYVDMVKYNVAPIYLADAMYDRFIDVYVPAIDKMNRDYYAVAPNARSSEFAAQVTYTGSSFAGFAQYSPITISIDECIRIDKQETVTDIYSIYVSDTHYESVVSQDSTYQKFGAYIGESADFDAIEYYGVSRGDDGSLGFVKDLIDILSTNAHDDWVITHQLTIQEWVGGQKITTGKFMDMQEADFDAPRYFRPILKYTGTEIAFEIDYTCRLFNRRNGEQIIRIGSMISHNHAKYGRSIASIQLDGAPRSHVVYNKIVKTSLEATDLFVEQSIIANNSSTQQSFTMPVASNAGAIKFTPVFFNTNKISVSQHDHYVDAVNPANDIIYRQGDLRFILNPFDNLIKFKVYNTNSSDVLIPMDLSSLGSFNLVMFNNNKKVRFEYLTDSGYSNLKGGEVSFKIPQYDSESLITSSNREFYVTVLTSDGTESALYGGFWNDVTEKDIVDANIAKVLDQQSSLARPGGTIPSTPSTFASFQVPASGIISEKTPVLNVPGYVPKSKATNDQSISNVIKPPVGQTTGQSV